MCKRRETEKKKEENTCRRKLYFLQRRRKTEKEKEENIWSMKITFWEKKSKEKKKENTRDWSVLNRSDNHIMNVNIVIIR